MRSLIKEMASQETLFLTQAIEPIPFTTDEELASFEALKQVVSRASIVCQSHFAPGTSTMYMIGFQTAKEQVQVLKPMIRVMNNAQRPDLAKLPIFPLPYNLAKFLELRRISGFPNDRLPSLADAERLAGTGEGLRVITLFLAAPQDTDEDAVCYIHMAVGQSDDEVEAALTRRLPPLLRRNHGELMALCAQRFCGHCHAQNAGQRCKGCGVIYYCSPLCHKIDWGQGHKEVCYILRLIKWRQAFGPAAHSVPKT
jgi:hypothetical protein